MTTKTKALDHVFSASAFRQLGKGVIPDSLKQLWRETDFPSTVTGGFTVGEMFNLAFDSLVSDGRWGDYVYRTALILNSLNSGCDSIISEVRVGQSKADLVVVGDGSAVAYEIKSERDSLNRLVSQIADYRKVFASVDVLTCPEYVDRVVQIIPDDVGVTVLEKSGILRVVREPQPQPERVEPVSVLDMLRIDEAKQVVSSIGVEVPSVSNTLIRTELAAIYRDLDPPQVHSSMVDVLSISRSLNKLSGFLEDLPTSLVARGIDTSLCGRDRRVVVGIMKQRVSAVFHQPIYL